MEPAERITAALADSYRVEAEIDTGGMATVYRARDLKHERVVAIKVLRPDLAEAIGADRFLREIRTTANLSHPHILPLHDSGEADGFLFYVMPFVRGESLRDRLDREGPLPVEDAVQIAREVAGALAYAHREGVIHRDIKPANILLEEGHALLADFGIAQARAGAEETRLTRGGMSLGTPAYMSPEQVAGDKEVDGRADQYALGCVLYEMLAGHAPFTGADVQTVLRQHLATDAPSVTQARPTVPRGVARAVHRALAKNPADRFRTLPELEKVLAGATLPLLARIPGGRARTAMFAAVIVLAAAAGGIALLLRSGEEDPGPVPNRVVVLPLENHLDDPDLADLGELAAYYVGQAIQRLELLQPVPVDVSLRYAAEARSGGSSNVPRDVAERTQAATAVAGTIFGIGDSLRFQVNVIDVTKEVALQPVAETGSSDRPMEAIARLGDRVAGALAYQLDPHNTSSPSLPSAPRLDAYRLSKAGFQAAERGDWEQAFALQRAAYDQDTTFATALAAAGFAASNLGNRAVADSLARFVDLRRDMLSREGELELEHLLGRLTSDWQRVLEATRERARLDPLGFPPVEHAYAALALNRPIEALEALRGYDPYAEWRGHDETRIYWTTLCRAYHMLGDHGQELEEARRARAEHPARLDVLRLELRADAALGRVEEVNRLLDEAPALEPNPIRAASEAGQELRAHGHADAARAVFQRAIEWLEERPGEGAEGLSHQEWLAFMLYHAERWEEAHAIHVVLAVEQSQSPEWLSWVGRSAARMGDTAEAREIGARLAEMRSMESDPEDLFRRASLAAVLGDADEAMRLLRRAISAGMRFDLSQHRAFDLESLRGREDYQQLMRLKG